MASETPFAKRIRRHVTGRVRNYFAATAPNFENLCYDELMNLPLSVKDAMIVQGGVEFKGRLQDCWLANLNLRTANRILMRIGEFKATNFTQLEKKLSEIPWELFITPGTDFPPQVSASSKHSRLYHKDAVAERFKASIENRFAHTESADQDSSNALLFSQKIFVRAADDHFTVSIDSSGEILYKRGIKTGTGKAPIRETTGAAVLKLAGYKPDEPLIDPMCGSGTFSLEGAMMAANIPPGWFRNFAFMGWPSFSTKRWAYIKRESEKQFIKTGKPHIFASDKNKPPCDAVEKTVEKYGLSHVIKVCHNDFLEFSPSALTSRTGLVVINPPYGHRIGTMQESDRLFYAVSKHLKKEYKGWKIALIAPDKKLVHKFPLKTTSHYFYHGGLKLVLLTGKIL
ncbi:MAG: hypothetical protein GY795_01630 [Desulfobacterales bacterium]|nr:hypothetical protein [Desulfobacterales bacterium]